MVDSVMIDTAYDGEAFDIAIAVRITNMLGEEVLVALPIAADA
ncbi:hypothetical protein BH24CHL9_BH24CHL9_03380 [soil metagenome]